MILERGMDTDVPGFARSHFDELSRLIWYYTTHLFEAIIGGHDEVAELLLRMEK